MEGNNQLDFRLKIYVLELNTSANASSTPTTTTADLVTDYVKRTIDIFNITQREMDYRAEGNANIVLAIPRRCQVLRLPKRSERLFYSSI